MRRWFCLAGVVAAALVSGPLAPGAGASAKQAKKVKVPTHLLVYAQEWSLWTSRATMPAGTIYVQLSNRGEDAHDVRVRRLNRAGHMVGPTEGVKVTLPGDLSQATWHLTKGRYELYCSMPGHLAMGMHTKITVT
jgi:uncharacterized cupredoxin-like copper-binding protein